jgi:hypothetical protein
MQLLRVCIYGQNLDGQSRVDANVNAGNCFAEWAELVPVTEQELPLMAACIYYKKAVDLEPDTTVCHCCCSICVLHGCMCCMRTMAEHSNLR